MIRTLILGLVATLALAGCDSSTPVAEEIGYGNISNDTYSNEYFNLSVKVPEGWAVQSEAQQAEMMRAGGELIAGGDTNLKNQLKASEKQSVSLFSFFKYEVGKPVPFNPSVIAVAEKIAGQPGIKRGSDYLYHVKKLLGSGQMQYSFPGEIEEVELSGVSFDLMTAALKAGPTTVYQEYYATKMNDYALGFIISYVSDEQKQELKAVIDDITFSN